MKESAKAQHEVDRAELAAAKAEAKSNLEENKGRNTFAKAKADAKKTWDDAHMSPAERAAVMQQEREARMPRQTQELRRQMHAMRPQKNRKTIVSFSVCYASGNAKKRSFLCFYKDTRLLCSVSSPSAYRCEMSEKHRQRGAVKPLSNLRNSTTVTLENVQSKEDHTMCSGTCSR